MLSLEFERSETMADIRNDQYLHRPGAGRGAVTPTDPMEVRIFDGAGNPVAPATETTLAAIQAAVGATNDSAVAAGAAGTVSAKLRRITADLADVLARLNTDLSTRASEQTLVQVQDALSALAGTVDAGAQKVTLSGSSAAEGGPPPTQIVAVGGRYDETPRALQSGQH